MIEIFLLLIAVFCFGFVAGWVLREKHAMKVVKSIVEKARAEYIEDIKKNIVDVKLEKAGDTFFIYSKEDGTFLAQGKTMTELEDNLSSRFPGKMFNTSPEDLKELESAK